MTSIFETVGFSGNRVQFSPFIDNMLLCVASRSQVHSNRCSPSTLPSSNTSFHSHKRSNDSDECSLCSSATTTHQSKRAVTDKFSKTISINSPSYDDHQSSLPLTSCANSSCASMHSSSPSYTGTGCLYILDHFIEDIANPLKCFRSFYWPMGALIDATWINENYLWSVSTDASIQVWNLASYLPIEDALSDLEPSPDPVQIISHAHHRQINSVDCNLISSTNPSIVSVAADAGIKLWDAKTATLLKSFHLHPSQSNCPVSQSHHHHRRRRLSSCASRSLLHSRVSDHAAVSSSSLSPDHHTHRILLTSGNHETDSHVDTISPHSNQVQHSTTLLQLLENSQCFQDMEETATHSNLFNSSSASVSSSPSSSSIIDSAVHSPSSAFSSYPNTPPSVNHPHNNDTCLPETPVIITSPASPRSSVSSNLTYNSLSNCVDVTYVAWSPLIPATFATTCNDGSVHLWSPRDDDTANLTFKVDCNNLTSCDWNKFNEYQLAISSSSGTMSLWDIRYTNAGPVTVINGHKKPVKQVKFSPHSPYLLASVSSDATTKIWNVTPSSLSYANDTVINGGDSRITATEQFTESLVDTYRHHSHHVCGFDFNPSIKDRVVDCGLDSLVCLYSLITPSLNRLSLKSTGSNVHLRPNVSNPSHSAVTSAFSRFSTVT